MCFLRLFGGVSLEECDDAAANEALPQRALAILALLATARDSGYSREKLIGYLWPESDGARARHRLADTVYQIRRSLCEDAVLTVGETLRLDADVVRSDVCAFQDALDAGQFTNAAELYRGPFLDGFFPNGGPSSSAGWRASGSASPISMRTPSTSWLPKRRRKATTRAPSLG